VTGASEDRLEFAPDLAETLAAGDAAYLGFLDLVDAHVARHSLDMPAEPEACSFRAMPPCVTQPQRQLALDPAGITSIIWATGYALDFGWIDIPVLDARGEPVHRKGVTDVPGLYFLGLPWLSRMNSSFMSGVGEDAVYLADHIAARQKSNTRTMPAA
jgi:putative flavoprotein involved in K+ transport